MASHRAPGTKRHELLAQLPPSSLPPTHRLPPSTGKALEHLICAAWAQGRVLFNLHREIARNAYHIGLSADLQPLQERWILPIVRIGNHRLVGNRKRPGFIQPLQGQLGLGLKLNLVGHSSLLTADRILRPRLRQIQAHTHRPMHCRIGIHTGHGYLTIGHLPHRATILMGHPHRRCPLLDKGRVIEDQHPISKHHLVAHPLYPLLVEGRLLPLDAGNQLLKTLRAGTRNGRGHGLGVLAGKVRQKPGAVAFQIIPPFRAVEVVGKRSKEVRQFRQRL